MTDRDHHLNVDDNEDDLVEIALVDLSSEDENASGPVDIRQSTEIRSNVSYSAVPVQRPPQLLHDELRLYRLVGGTLVRPGDIVELECPEHRKVEAEYSGDFLRVVRILRECSTGEIILRGHRYLREKYLITRDSDAKGAKLNEVVRHLTVIENDNRPAEVQGLEDIPVAKVLQKQAIIFTDKTYPYQTWGYQQQFLASLMSIPKAEWHLHIFKHGRLVCRRSKISIISPNGRVYGGEYRHLSKRMAKPQHLQQLSQQPRNNTTVVPTVHQRTPSVEEVSEFQPRDHCLPSKREAYVFFDAYCGAGGASRGADYAGLKVIGGFDCDVLAMEAWELNFPGGVPFRMDAAAFLDTEALKIVGRVDIMNISFPCQPYSSAHTIPGKNDKINIEQLGNIKPLIEQLRPRVVILENAFGLATIQKNRPFFNKVLNAVFNAGSGYNLRYKIINIADYGLPQERKRLIIIAARKDNPLPPFPKPTHGPAGSGLKPYNSVGDALMIIERLGERADRDSYHRLHKQTRPAEHLYDPFTKFVDCIMTTGVTSPHWSGDDFTPRELAILQSLPYHHYLTGSWTEAIKQLGNMFPPVITEMIYRICAQTLEAFDHGFTDADEDIDDLNVTLVEKGINIPERPATASSLFDLTGPPSQSTFKYLSRPILSDADTVDFSSAFAKRHLELRRSKRPLQVGEDEETPSPQGSRKRATMSARGKLFGHMHERDVIEVSDSEEDCAKKNFCKSY